VKIGIKRLLRRVAKPVVSKIRNVLADVESSPAPPDLSNEDTPYPWLNWLLETSVQKSQGRLRPNYSWAMLHAAYLAKALGMPRISAIEFGVAGGNGLLALENAAELVEQEMGIEIDVYGFDTGAGLPPPLDYRDLPNLYTATAYQMDVDKLKSRLKRARLILGLIEETVPTFLLSNPAPIGFMSIDVDYYTSTAEVLKALECDQGLLMPRVHCYFDDMMGFTFSEYTGERLAITEFNNSHQMRKISPIFGLKYFLPRRYSGDLWCEQMYIAHIFDHDLYGRDDGLVIRHNDGFTALKQICLAPLVTFPNFADLVPIEAMMC
jgi:hypothetical protein